MPCVHLTKLYHLCEDEGLKISGSDLIRMVCPQCGIQEECPSMLVEEYEAKESTERQRESIKTASDQQ